MTKEITQLYDELLKESKNWGFSKDMDDKDILIIEENVLNFFVEHLINISNEELEEVVNKIIETYKPKKLESNKIYNFEIYWCGKTVNSKLTKEELDEIIRIFNKLGVPGYVIKKI